MIDRLRASLPSARFTSWMRSGRTGRESRSAGTSSGPRNEGQLHALRLTEAELRIASRDGNLPFALCLRASALQDEPICIVNNLEGALRRIWALEDALRFRVVDDALVQADGPELKAIMQDQGGSNAGLVRLARTLCNQDDQRLDPGSPWAS